MVSPNQSISAITMLQHDMNDRDKSNPWIIVCEAVDGCGSCGLVMLSVESIALDGGVRSVLL